MRWASYFTWSLILFVRTRTLNVPDGHRTYNKEKHEALAVASKEEVPELNADKTKYLVMS
jgi:hypothetical protein